VGRGDHGRVAAHRRTPASSLTSTNRPCDQGRRTRGRGTPGHPARQPGRCRIPALKSRPQRGPERRPTSAINPDERSGLATPIRACSRRLLSQLSCRRCWRNPRGRRPVRKRDRGQTIRHSRRHVLGTEAGRPELCRAVPRISLFLATSLPTTLCQVRTLPARHYDKDPLATCILQSSSLERHIMRRQRRQVPECDLNAAALRQHASQNLPELHVRPRRVFPDVLCTGPCGRVVVVLFHKQTNASRPPGITA